MTLLPRQHLRSIRLEAPDSRATSIDGVHMGLGCSDTKGLEYWRLRREQAKPCRQDPEPSARGYDRSDVDTVQFNPFRRVTRHTGVICDVSSPLSQVTAVADACD